ncbi:hypothetical protein ZWY2020_052073 [Hordeum vulgare]|nr:hypothetical protein ZWY2020_052073 [Hordeum vulgare]
MFCTQSPPPTKQYPLPSTSDPRSTTPSSKRKQVTIDVEAADEDRQRLYYTKDEDIRLVTAWLRNSVNPIDRNAKKGEYYWKEVADTFNSTTESDRKRDVKHLKNQWYKKTKKQALELYHSRNGHPFTYVHWWEAVKDNQKWKIHVYTEGDGTKRSAPTPTENAQRPPGTKRAKKATGKEKEAPTEMNDMKEQVEAFLQAQADAKPDLSLFFVTANLNLSAKVGC